MHTILLTHASGPLATIVAGTLARHADWRLVGMTASPHEPAASRLPPHLDRVVPAVTGHALVDLLQAEQVTTLVQSGHPAMMQPPPTKSDTDEIVLRTLELLGACVRAGVQRVVLLSSTLVYGARPKNPAFMSEMHPLARRTSSGLVTLYVELEVAITAFLRSHPQLHVEILRCAPLVGGDICSPLTCYLRCPDPRTVMGFNPRIQVLHPDDAAAAIGCLLEHPSVAGVTAYNIAACDPVPLVQAIRLTGKQPLPLPLPLIELATRMGTTQALRPLLGAWSLPWAYLRYPCVADIRCAQHELGWQPAYCAVDLLRSLAPRRRSGK